MTLSDVKILKKCGTYNGAVIVIMERESYAVITSIQVDEVDFTFDDSNIALVLKDDQFYELSDAYHAGILTKKLGCSCKRSKQIEFKIRGRYYEGFI